MARPMELPNPQEAPWATMPAREPTAEGADDVCERAGGGAPPLERGAERGGGAERRRPIWGGELCGLEGAGGWFPSSAASDVGDE